MTATQEKAARKTEQHFPPISPGFLLAPILAALLFAPACSSPPGQAEKSVSDSQITIALESEYWTDDALDANGIDVRTDSGVVTLSGRVDSLLERERAVRIAASTVGVRGIINQIEVNPSYRPSNTHLQRAVKAALLADPATEAYQTTVTAKDGVVSLTGTSESWHEKRLCAQVAMSVRGVRGIQNNIVVKYRADRSDREIEAEVKARLANDVLIDAGLISVDVKNKKVILEGTVGSLAEKNRVNRDAWVAGVDEVDAQQLQVKWWMRDEMRRTGSYTARSDEDIEKAVADAFLYDPRVNAFNPIVSVDDGKVTLSGVVDNLPAKKAAQQDARNVVGVRRVKNYLKVRPKILPPNDELKERVATALRQDPYLDRWDIDINIRNGWVYLSGKVNTNWEANHARRKAAEVKGVIRVINNLEYDYIWEWRPDWEIEEDIKEELFWSPFVDEDDIEVHVRNGVATLKGQAVTWSERDAAENNAYEGGAKEVDNDLTVTFPSFGPYYGPYHRGLTWYPPFYPG